MANNLEELIGSSGIGSSEGSTTVNVETSSTPSSSVPVESDSTEGRTHDSNESDSSEIIDPDALDKYRGIETPKAKVAPTDENLNPQDVDKQELNKPLIDPKAEKAISDPVKSEVKPVSPQPKSTVKADGRDYSGFSDEETTLLKRTPNEVFNYVAPKLKELSNLTKEKGELQGSYDSLKKASEEFKYYDEHGYIKDNRFLESKQIEDQGTKELQFWEQQLVRIESGLEWSDISGKTYPASPEMKVAVSRQIAKIDNIIASNVNRAESIKANWEAKHINHKSYWRELEDKHFPNYKGKENDNKWIKGMDKVFEESGQAGNPVKGTFNKLYAAFMEMREAYSKLLNEKSVTTVAKEISSKAGPSSSSIVNGTISKDKSDLLDMDEFDNYRKTRK